MFTPEPWNLAAWMRVVPAASNVGTAATPHTRSPPETAYAFRGRPLLGTPAEQAVAAGLGHGGERRVDVQSLEDRTDVGAHRVGRHVEQQAGLLTRVTVHEAPEHVAL